MHRATGSLLNYLRKDASIVSSGHFGCFMLRTNGFLAANVSKRQYMAKAAQEPFLNGSSSVYVEEMYKSWQQDPNSVHKVRYGIQFNYTTKYVFDIVMGCILQVGFSWSSTRSSISKSTILDWFFSSVPSDTWNYNKWCTSSP